MKKIQGKRVKIFTFFSIPWAYFFIFMMAHNGFSKMNRNYVNNRDLLIVLQKTPLELDPYTYLSLPEWYVHMNITSTLVKITPNNELIPGIAREWAVYNKNKTYRFILNTNMRWSDGSFITPNQVLTSIFEKARHRNAKYLKKYLKEGPLEEAVYLENGNELVLHLKFANPSFIFQLTRPEFGVIRWDLLSSSHFITSQTPTSGDYTISFLDNEYLELVPNEFGTKIKDENPQKIIFRFVDSQDLILKLLKDEKLSFIEIQSKDILEIGENSKNYKVINGSVTNLATFQTRNLEKDQKEAIKVFAKYLDRSKFITDKNKLIATEFVVGISERKLPSLNPNSRININQAKKELNFKNISIEILLGQESTIDQINDANEIIRQGKEIGINFRLKIKKDYRRFWEAEDYESSQVRMGLWAFDEVELIHGYFCAGFKPYQSLTRIVCPNLEKTFLSGISEVEINSILDGIYEDLIIDGSILPLYHFPRKFLIHKKWNLEHQELLLPFPLFWSFTYNNNL